MKTIEELEDEILILAEEISEAEYNLNLMKAKYEMLCYELLVLDNEQY